MCAKLTREPSGFFEQRRTQASIAMVPPDVQERELDEVALRPEENRVDDRDPHDPIAVEDGYEARSPVERGLEPRQRVLRLAGWPTRHIEEQRPRDERAVSDVEDLMDDLAPIDFEDATDLLTPEATPGEAVELRRHRAGRRSAVKPAPI